VDPSAIQSVKGTRGRHHPGRTQPRKVQRLPGEIEEAIEKILKGLSLSDLVLSHY